MRTRVFLTTLVAGFLAPSLLSGSQVQAPKGELINQLQGLYPVTVMDANGFKVTTPGTIFVVQKNGIQANPMKSGPFLNTYSDGQVTSGGHGVRGKLDPGGIKGLFATPRTLPAGEKVYLLKMEVQDDGIVMTVQTCGICDPAAVDPAHKPYIASIQFTFVKGFWGATDLKHVEVAISSLLVFPSPAPAVSTEPAAQAAQPDPAQDGHPTIRHADGAQTETQSQPVKYADLPPPAPPPANPPTLRRADEIKSTQTQAQTGPGESSKQPKADVPAPPRSSEPPQSKVEIKTETKPEIGFGWSRDQVRAVLGQPDKTDTPRGQEIYRYKHVNVTFEHGKVAAVEYM